MTACINLFNVTTSLLKEKHLKDMKWSNFDSQNLASCHLNKEQFKQKEHLYHKLQSSYDSTCKRIYVIRFYESSRKHVKFKN